MSELDIYEHQGLGKNSGFGNNPALLIVDFVNGFANPDQFGGGNIGPAIENTRTLLASCRANKVPVAFTRVVYAEDGSDTGAFTLKVPALKTLTEDAESSQIIAELEPKPGEAIVRKRQPSAFFGTELLGWLIKQSIDTILVTGCTTSGCVRASVIDSLSYNFLTIVVTDCVGDRAIAPHEANLFDMGQKYADLMDSDQVMREIEQSASAA